MDLTTIDRVKTMLAQDTGGTWGDETFAGELIDEVSALAAKLLDRKVLTQSYTEQLDVSGKQVLFELAAWPVTSITSVKLARDHDFASVDALDADRYVTDNDLGLLVFLSPPVGFTRLAAYFRALQVVYTGGMAADTTSFMTAYPDIAEAVTRQVVYAYKRRLEPGATSEAMRDGGIAHDGAYRWLPDVLATFGLHRRAVCVG